MLNFLLCVAAFVLGLATADSSDTPADFFRTGPDTHWFNTDNWDDGHLPQAGEVVSFPPSFSLFGREQCKSTDASCRYGGNAVISPVNNLTAEVDLGRLEIPDNGRLGVDDGVSIYFYPVTEYYNGSAVDPNSPEALWTNLTVHTATWKQRSTQEYDLTCGMNWDFNGTGSNPSFFIPCVNDTVNFLADKSYMAFLSRKSFISNLVDPQNVLSDRYEFYGEQYSSLLSNCEALYSTEKGEIYCRDICINTCPERHPNYVAGLQLQINQNKTLVQYLVTPIQQAAAQQNRLSGTIKVSGSASFAVPPSSASSANAFVITKLTATATTLPLPFTVQCTSALTSITCSFGATVTLAKLSYYSSSTQLPYTFKTGLLNSIFDAMVASWFTQASKTLTSQNANAIASQSSLSTTGYLIANRFFDTLDSDTIATALSQSVGGAFVDTEVVLGPTNDTQTLIVYTANANTSSLVRQVLLNPTTIFTVNGVPVYTSGDSAFPSVQTIGAVQITLNNPGIFEALPFNSTDQADFLQTFIGFVNDQTLNSVSFPVFAVSVARVSSSRRGSSTVAVTVTTSSASGFTSQIVIASYASLNFNGYSSSSPKIQTVAVDAAERARVAAEAVLLAQQATDYANQVASQAAFLTQYGIGSGNAGNATYPFTDANIIDVTAAQPELLLTYGECHDLNAYLASSSSLQAAFVALVAVQMSLVLPVPAIAITFPFGLSCQAVDPFQTLPYQPAIFNVATVNIIAPYQLFAQGASYVVLPTGVNTAQQPASESGSLLSQANVLAALEDALRLATLTSLSSYYTAQAAQAQNMYNTATASSSTGNAAGLSLVVVAAAAGGGVVLLVVVLIIVIRRRRAAASPKTRDARAVVAFENPMYDTRGGSAGFSAAADISAHEGLYDEPAFLKTTTDKSNPLYDSNDKLINADEFTTAIGALQAGFEMNHPDDGNGDGQGFGMSLTMDPDFGDAEGYLDLSPSEVVPTIANPLFSSDAHNPNYDTAAAGNMEPMYDAIADVTNGMTSLQNPQYAAHSDLIQEPLYEDGDQHQAEHQDEHQDVYLDVNHSEAQPHNSEQEQPLYDNNDHMPGGSEQQPIYDAIVGDSEYLETSAPIQSDNYLTADMSQPVYEPGDNLQQANGMDYEEDTYLETSPE